MYSLRWDKWNERCIALEIPDLDFNCAKTIY